MALKNKSMYAILGILNIAPSTGYDIKKYSDEVLSGFWNENFGHIYPTLKMLLENEMIEIVSKEENDRKVRYGITPKGKNELALWLTADISLQPMRSEFMLKLLFSDNQSKEAVIQMLVEYKALHENNLKLYSEKQKILKEKSDLFSMERARIINVILRRAILSDKAVIMWCDETIDELVSN